MILDLLKNIRTKKLTKKLMLDGGGYFFYADVTDCTVFSLKRIDENLVEMTLKCQRDITYIFTSKKDIREVFSSFFVDYIPQDYIKIEEGGKAAHLIDYDEIKALFVGPTDTLKICFPKDSALYNCTNTKEVLAKLLEIEEKYCASKDEDLNPQALLNPVEMPKR